MMVTRRWCPPPHLLFRYNYIYHISLSHISSPKEDERMKVVQKPIALVRHYILNIYIFNIYIQIYDIYIYIFILYYIQYVFYTYIYIHSICLVYFIYIYIVYVQCILYIYIVYVQYIYFIFTIFNMPEAKRQNSNSGIGTCQS